MDYSPVPGENGVRQTPNAEFSVPNGVPAMSPPEVPPTPPVPAGALSVVTAAPVPPGLKKEIRASRGRSSMIFIVLTALLVAAMVLNGIYTMPDGGFSTQSMVGILAVFLLCIVWKLLFWLVDRNTKTPVAFDTLRINEVYAQGVMSTGMFDRVVIPFDEVTSCVETQNWLALYSRDGEIVWLASDLTPEESANLFAALAAHLPQTVFIRKSVLLPRKLYDGAPGVLPAFSPPVESLPARWSAAAAAKNGFAALLKKAAPLFFLMSMILANILCDSFDWFSEEPFAGRLLLMAVGALLCAGIGYVLVLWEQTAMTREFNARGVRLHILSDGIRIDDGANFTVIPQEGIHFSRDKNGTLRIPLGNRELTVRYTDFCRSAWAREIFKS